MKLLFFENLLHDNIDLLTNFFYTTAMNVATYPVQSILEILSDGVLSLFVLSTQTELAFI